VTIRSVALIGVGSMGAAVARHIQDAGHALIACDLDEAVLARFEARGARACRRGRDCADADLVIVLVTTAAQMRAVLLGPDGLAAGLSPGHKPWVAVMSTVPLGAVEQLHAELGDRIAGLCDVPISGGPARAEQGTLTVLAGGEPAVLEAIEPVLRTFSSTIVRCGGLGKGQAMKVVNNILGNAAVALSAEAYRLANDLGLDTAATAAALEQGTGRNLASAPGMDLAGFYAAMVGDRAGFDSLLGIIRKDYRYAAELASAQPGRYPMILGVQSLFEGLGDETFDNWRFIGHPEPTRPSTENPS